MKRIIIFFLFAFSISASAQTSWTVSNQIVVTGYGNIDSISSSSIVPYLDPYYPQFIRQPMKTNFIVVNDSLYLLDSLKTDFYPTNFYSKLIGADSLQVVLDTLPSYSDPGAYRDEDFDTFIFSQPYYLLQVKTFKMNLGHVSQVPDFIKYKSIWYRINALGSIYTVSPEWFSRELLSDTTITSPPNYDFFVLLEDTNIVFYHSSYVPATGYHQNISTITNDTIYSELYPSRMMSVPIPLAKTTSSSLACLRSSIVSINEFVDTIHIGYYYERANIGFSRKQFFNWVVVSKDSNNNISYSHNVQPNALVFLSVRELTVTASQNQDANLIQWVTIGEENMHSFEVEKSTSGINFRSVHTTPARGGNEAKNYSFYDNNPGQINYYRIKAVDNDNKYVYSNTVIVRRKHAITGIQVVPNPSSGQVYISGQDFVDYKVMVRTTSGKIISSAIFTGNETIDLTDQPNGIYFVEIHDLFNNEIQTNKIIKQ